MMTLNPIEEIKRIRHQLGAKADFDVHRIFEELRASQASSGRSYVQGTPRRIADNQALQPSSGGQSTLHNKSNPGTG
jgi:hypothetical protein